MSINHTFRKKSYLGKAVYLDIETKDIVATGHGLFDVESMTMDISLTALASGHFRRIMVILSTAEGHVAPFITYNRTLLINMPIDASYDMEAYLRWPANADPLAVTRAFRFIDIVVRAQHSVDSVSSAIHEKGITARITNKATATQISEHAYKGLKVTISAGYTLRRNSQKARSQYQSSLDTYMKYRFEREAEAGNFRVGDIGRALLAFKLYWINHHDTVDCTITTIKLGDYVTLTLAEDKLQALSTNIPTYRAIPVIQAQLHADTLAKMAHFFFNPQKRKTLSSSSKAGLAFVRIVDHRFRIKNKILDMDIASLIFALQSLSESIAEGEIKKQNRASAKATKEGISAVLAKIRSIEHVLPEEVASFYLRSQNEIYNSIARPTFMQSLEVSLKKLNISISRHQQMLRTIDKARRQVVHSEGYSAEFLLNLIAHSAIKTRVGDDGLVRSVVVKQRVSEMEKLYALLRKMIHSYFNQYDR